MVGSSSPREVQQPMGQVELCEVDGGLDLGLGCSPARSKRDLSVRTGHEAVDLW